MYIARGIHPNILKPQRGDMCSRDTWRKFNAMTPRGKDAEKSGIETVAVGSPNPLGLETKPLR